MKQEERDILGIKKKKEGKSVEQIREEIYYLDDFQREMKSDKKIIFKLNNDNEKLQKKIEALNKKIFNYELTKDTIQTKAIRLGELNKIIALTDSDKLPKSELRALCNMTIEKVNCATSFLVKYNIIEETIIKGAKFYGKKV